MSKYFLSVCTLSFQSLSSIFCRAKAFNFNGVQFLLYLFVYFYGLCFWCQVEELFAQAKVTVFRYSFKTLTVSYRLLTPVVHLEFVFVHGVRHAPILPPSFPTVCLLFLWHTDVKFLLHHSLTRLFFGH